MDYKMIFSDMDGTLLKNDIEISVKNKEAILKAVAKGVDFVLCTGRGVFGVEGTLKELGLIGRKGYVICQNGGAVYDLTDMSLLIRRSFSPRIYAPFATMARGLGLELYYYDDRKFMTETVTARAEKYCEIMGTDMMIMEDPSTYKGEFTKCLLTGKKEDLLLVQAEIKRFAGEELEVFFSSDIFMEVVKKGVSKGNSLEETAEKAGVSVDEVIAIGDSDNDLSMILRAGLGVAVANAEQAIKDAADYITQSRCEEDAVAEVIEKFILMEVAKS